VQRARLVAFQGVSIERVRRISLLIAEADDAHVPSHRRVARQVRVLCERGHSQADAVKGYLRNVESRTGEGRRCAATRLAASPSLSGGLGIAPLNIADMTQ
jgi:hypothetical protein